MNQFKVSVIIAVYNVEKYLRQCMDSVVNQTLHDIEIICVDDGSTDSSLSILKDYQIKDARVKIYAQQNKGAGAARNLGLQYAAGAYLAFLDADDFFELDMLEKAYAAIRSAQAQIVVFRSDQYREDLGEFVQVNWTIRQDELPPYRPINCRNMNGNVFKVFVGWAWDKLFEKKYIDEHQFWFQEQRTSNDMLFVFSAIAFADRIEVIDEILAHQRRNDPNSLSNTRAKSWDCFYKALIALRNALKEHGNFWEYEQDYINYALHFSLWNLDTIGGDQKEVLYSRLKSEWFETLGICGKKAGYFYNKNEYRKYQTIMKKPMKVYFKSDISKE